MVSVDIYVNETTRHADVILPAPSPLEQPHYDLALLPASRCATSRTTRRRCWSRPSGCSTSGRRCCASPAIAAGQGPTPTSTRSTTSSPRSSSARRLTTLAVEGATPTSCWRSSRARPERVLDLMLRPAPTATASGRLTAHARRRSRQRRTASTSGRCEPRLPEVLRTPSGRSSSRREPIVADVARLRAALERARNGGMVLVGRRDLRSNNSWMHNLPLLVSGPERCTAARPSRTTPRGSGWPTASAARVSSRAGAIEFAGRGDRRRHARRRLDPARLGPRRRRRAARRRRRRTPASTPTCSPTSRSSSRSPATPCSTASRSKWRRCANLRRFRSDPAQNQRSRFVPFASWGMKSPMKIFSSWQPRSFALAAVLAAATAAPASAVGVTQIHTDPFTNAPASTRPRSSPTPSPSGHTIATFQVGRFFNGGASDIGLRAPPTAARRWTQDFLPGLTSTRAVRDPDSPSSASATRASPTTPSTTRG